MQFVKAERQQVKLKLAVTGPSGAGKTWGALELAAGLVPGGRVAVIDTENGSASLYADRFAFDVLRLDPPYLTGKYSEALKAAIAGGYDVVIIDSITHEWAGEGGLLDQKSAKDSANPRSNSFTNWADITKQHEAFKGQLLAANIHVIATMRSKTEYQLQQKDGKMAPVKLGMAPIQRDGMEYEFSVVFDVAQNHEALASKDRTALFDQRSFRLSKDIGSELRAWMLQGNAPPPAAPPPPPASALASTPAPSGDRVTQITEAITKAASEADLRKLAALISKEPATVKAKIRGIYSKRSAELKVAAHA